MLVVELVYSLFFFFSPPPTHPLQALYEKQISAEVNGDELGDAFKGYILKITGGNDKQGFPMMQGVLVQGRVRLLLKEGQPCIRTKRPGHRKRKSVRGCIVGPDIAILALTIVKKGAEEIEGLTDVVVPRKMGPKRASKIRKLFALGKDDKVTKFVLHAELPPKKEGGKPIVKVPKVQRLITPSRIRDKRRKFDGIKAKQAKSKADAAEYAKLLRSQAAALAERRESTLSKKRTSVKRAAPAAAAVAEPEPEKKKVKKVKKSSSSTDEKVAKKTKKSSSATKEEKDTKTKSTKTKSSKSKSSDAAEGKTKTKKKKSSSKAE